MQSPLALVHANIAVLSFMGLCPGMDFSSFVIEVLFGNFLKKTQFRHCYDLLGEITSCIYEFTEFANMLFDCSLL